MTRLWPALLLVGVLASALALPAFSRTTAPRTPAASPSSRLTGTLVVVSSAEGMRVSSDGGRRWRRPRGLPARGAFYTVAVDPTRRGTAYAANGDVYRTTDSGAHWTLLTPPSQWLGPAGVTAISAAPDGAALFAAGAGVLAYLPARGRWVQWGARWPQSRAPRLLFAAGSRLYAGADAALYVTTGRHAPWRRVDTGAWGSAPVSALGLGPDGVTLLVAVRGRGVWYVGANGRADPLNNAGLPDGASVYALRSDPFDDDLYAATGAGLFVQHQPGTGPLSAAARWYPVSDDRGTPIAAPVVALRPLLHGLLAVTRHGELYQGLRAAGRPLAWTPLSVAMAQELEPLIAALTGAEWQGAARPLVLPAAFMRPARCLLVGSSLVQVDRAFNVCGRFLTFYLANGSSTVFGAPRGRALVGANRVEQSFEKAALIWSRTGGVGLEPRFARLATTHPFPRPTAQQTAAAVSAGVPFVGGYYVDPTFYPFWRQYQQNGVSIFGAPISEKVDARSADGTGRIVPVQYFANVRMEYHPELPPGSRVQLSYIQR